MQCYMGWCMRTYITILYVCSITFDVLMCLCNCCYMWIYSFALFWKCLYTRRHPVLEAEYRDTCESRARKYCSRHFESARRIPLQYQGPPLQQSTLVQMWSTSLWWRRGQRCYVPRTLQSSRPNRCLRTHPNYGYNDQPVAIVSENSYKNFRANCSLRDARGQRDCICPSRQRCWQQMQTKPQRRADSHFESTLV